MCYFQPRSLMLIHLSLLNCAYLEDLMRGFWRVALRLHQFLHLFQWIIFHQFLNFSLLLSWCLLLLTLHDYLHRLIYCQLKLSWYRHLCNFWHHLSICRHPQKISFLQNKHYQSIKKTKLTSNIIANDSYRTILNVLWD